MPNLLFSATHSKIAQRLTRKCSNFALKQKADSRQQAADSRYHGRYELNSAEKQIAINPCQGNHVSRGAVAEEQSRQGSSYAS